VPTYKQRPHLRKSDEPLPLYRPIDKLAIRAVENRRKLFPIFVTVLVLLAAFAAFKAYSAYYESKASSLFNRGDLETAAKEYGRSRAAKAARIKLGRTALDAGEYDRAASWLAPLAHDPKAPDLLRIAAEQNLALVHLKKGEAAKAAEILERAAKDPKNAGADYTGLLLARAHEENGDKDRALAIYRTLAEGAKEPAVKLEARERQKWLEPETKPAAPSPSR
jgi:tetratricopeptide (TPR) repeat protein